MPFPSNIIYVLFFFSGIASFIYQIAYTRIFKLFLGNTTHSFGIILAAFLMGIAGGSFIFILILKKRKKIFMPPSFAFLQLILAFLAMGTMYLVGKLDILYLFPWKYFRFNSILFSISKFLLATLIMLPLTILIGITSPLSVAILEKFSIGRPGTESGKIFFFNSIGNFVGAILTGFILIPLLKLRVSLVTAAIINVSIATFIILFTNKNLKNLIKAIFIFPAFILFYSAIPQWNKNALNSAVWLYADEYMEPHEKISIAEKLINRREIIFSSSWLAYYNLGKIFYLQNLRTKAEKNLKKSILLNPRFFLSYELLGKIYSEKGKKKKEKRIYISALSYGCQNAEILYRCGKIFFSEGKKEIGLFFLRKATALDPSYFDFM